MDADRERFKPTQEEIQALGEYYAYLGFSPPIIAVMLDFYGSNRSGPTPPSGAEGVAV